MKTPALIATIAALAATATAANTPTKFIDPVVERHPENLGVTYTTIARQTAPEVHGQPYMAKGHPRALWDSNDIAYYRELAKTDDTFKGHLDNLRARMDKRIAEPVGIPDGRKDEEGNWIFPDKFEQFNTGPRTSFYSYHFNWAQTMAQLAQAYAIFDEPKYGEFCRQMLLAYAENYSKWGFPDNCPRHRHAIDGRLSYQFLGEAGHLTLYAFAYDLVHNLPSWTPEERKLVNQFFRDIVYCFLPRHNTPEKPTQYNPDHFAYPNNRTAQYIAATVIAAIATDDREMLDWALYGYEGTKENPVSGVFGNTFTRNCISEDGQWKESMGYQVTMVASAVTTIAECLWKNGIDIYRHDNGILKRLFETVVEFGNPDPEITNPMMNDSAGRAPAWGGIDIQTIEYAYRRYKEPTYLHIIKNISPKKAFAHTWHIGAPPLYLGASLPDAPSRDLLSLNYFETGYGVLRLPRPDPVEGTTQLIFMFGPTRDHAHPDRLGIDLYTMGQHRVPDHGIYFPYNNPWNRNWQLTTFGHAAMTVDEEIQRFNGYSGRYPRTDPTPEAIQTLYAHASTFGMQRGHSNTIYGGVLQDRSLFLTGEYLADLFSAYSEEPRTYDVTWQMLGDMKTDLAFKSRDPWPEPPAITAKPTLEDIRAHCHGLGYNALGNPRSVRTPNPWTASFDHEGKVVTIHAVGSKESEIITGDGFFRLGKDQIHPPMVFERRADQKNTVFATVLDISNSGYIKSVSQEGDTDQGYALLRIETAKGIDECYAAYGTVTNANNANNEAGASSKGQSESAPAAAPLVISGISGIIKKAGTLETDAIQAHVMRDGEKVRAMYLGGGTILKTKTASISRDTSGLAFIERTPAGNYIVGNPSPSAATLTVAHPDLKGLKAYPLNIKYERLADAQPVPFKPTPTGVEIKLAGATCVEFTK